jgi:hypothetical protein
MVSWRRRIVSSQGPGRNIPGKNVNNFNKRKNGRFRGGKVPDETLPGCELDLAFTPSFVENQLMGTQRGGGP